SDDAFEVIRSILKERSMEIPQQSEPVYEVEKETTKEISDEDGLEEWEAKILDDENQPEFYDTVEVITLKNYIEKAATAVIAVYTLQSISTFPWVSQLVSSFFRDRQPFMPLVYIIAFVYVTLGAAVSIAIVYFPLKALAHILRILMEMEFKSRKGA
ncbi:MAG TPA: hypothetical protein VKP08_09610, partial [Anaerolineales bacterium]|nr:hypothetical protein [Anaerolineales bacterium]